MIFKHFLLLLAAHTCCVALAQERIPSVLCAQKKKFQFCKKVKFNGIQVCGFASKRCFAKACNKFKTKACKKVPHCRVKGKTCVSKAQVTNSPTAAPTTCEFALAAEEAKTAAAIKRAEAAEADLAAGRDETAEGDLAAAIARAKIAEADLADAVERAESAEADLAAERDGTAEGDLAAAIKRAEAAEEGLAAEAEKTAAAVERAETAEADLAAAVERAETAEKSAEAAEEGLAAEAEKTAAAVERAERAETDLAAAFDEKEVWCRSDGHGMEGWCSQNHAVGMSPYLYVQNIGGESFYDGQDKTVTCDSTWCFYEKSSRGDITIVLTSKVEGIRADSSSNDGSYTFIDSSSTTDILCGGSAYKHGCFFDP